MSGEERFGRGGLNEYVDIDQLVEEIGLDESEIQWRKEFIGFDDEDARRLAGFEDLFASHANEIADSFYEHLAGFEQTRAILDRSPKSVEQLKQTQKAYLLTLARGEYDTGYFTNRARIGKLHELLDMPLKHYIGQYNVYYGLLLELVTDRIHDRIADTVETELDVSEETLDRQRLTDLLSEDVDRSIDELHSLLKLLNLDLQVAVDTYTQSRLDDLEVERDRFAALFENVPTPVVVVQVTDGGMRVERVNAAFETLFGYTADDLADKHFERYLSPPGEEPRPIEDRGIVENVRDGAESELSEAEVTLETQFGRREFIRVSAPVERETVDDLEYAFYIDVTDQKQRQERLQVLSRVLRHDIRNRITVVQSCATLLEGGVDDDTRERTIERMQRSADRLLATSRQIREIEEVVAGDADRHPVNVLSRVKDALASVRERYPDCAFSLSAGNPVQIEGTDALEIAIEEVIDNAVRHNDDSDPHVEISVTRSLDGQYVDVRVADNGPGIPPAEYEVLTGERDRSQVDHPSGLGLWTVNWLVKRAGGTLDFTANSPRGSIVTLRFPRVTDE